MTRDFDANLFRELHPAYENEADATCEKLWATRFRAEAGAYTEANRLKKIGLDLDRFPDAFPWRSYAIIHPGAGANRWTALEHFVTKGFNHIGVGLSFGSDAAAFLFALGRRLAKKDDRLAIRAFEAALARDDPPRAVRKWLADAYMRHQIWLAGRRLYVEVIDEVLAAPHGQEDAAASDGSKTYVVELARGFLETCNRLDCWDGFFERVAALSRRDPSLCEQAPKIADTFYQRKITESRQHYADGDKGAGDLVIEAAVAEVAAFVAACTQAVRPNMIAKFQKGRIVIAADVANDGLLPDRLQQHKSSLESLGFEVVVVSIHSMGSFAKALSGARAAIFVEAPAFPSMVAAVLLAKASGVATYYEVGDLIVDRDHSPRPLSYYDGLLGRRNHVDLLVGAALYRCLAGLCDYGIAPTEALAAWLTPVVKEKRSFTVRIAARPTSTTSRASSAKASEPDVSKSQPAKPTSFFIHSPRPFKFDQRDPAAAALIELLRSRDDVVVYVVGYLQLGRVFDAHRSKIERLAVETEYFEVLRHAHVNLALDQVGEVGDCSSESNWLDAALLRVPTIAHASTSAKQRLDDGSNVILASTMSEWLDAMTSMIADPGRRESISAAAYARASTYYTVAASRADYEAIFTAQRE